MFGRFIVIVACLAFTACSALEKRTWNSDFYGEHCSFSNYQSKWEDKHCPFRPVKVDPGATRKTLDQQKIVE